MFARFPVALTHAAEGAVRFGVGSAHWKGSNPTPASGEPASPLVLTPAPPSELLALPAVPPPELVVLPAAPWALPAVSPVSPLAPPAPADHPRLLETPHRRSRSTPCQRPRLRAISSRRRSHQDDFRFARRERIELASLASVSSRRNGPTASTTPYDSRVGLAAGRRVLARLRARSSCGVKLSPDENAYYRGVPRSPPSRPARSPKQKSDIRARELPESAWPARENCVTSPPFASSAPYSCLVVSNGRSLPPRTSFLLKAFETYAKASSLRVRAREPISLPPKAVGA